MYHPCCSYDNKKWIPKWGKVKCCRAVIILQIRKHKCNNSGANFLKYKNNKNNTNASYFWNTIYNLVIRCKKTYLYINFKSTRLSFKMHLYLFIYLCICLSSHHTCYMPCPSHSSRFDRMNKICYRVQIIMQLIKQFTPLPFYLIPLRLKYSTQRPILKHPQPTFLPQCQRPS